MLTLNNTSRKCNDCKTTTEKAGRKSLSRCPVCGYVGHSDSNRARNIPRRFQVGGWWWGN
ncbi:MAG: transposase [Treponema sp.]|nr:transposase [Treponema sp.]